jgi:hypothetical protein
MLGSQSSVPITVPNNDGTSAAPPWALQTVDFTYSGGSPSATLTLIQNFSGVNLGCAPCAEFMWLANVSLQDLTEPPPPPPPPPPQVAEPSSLLTTALGLGLLGLYLRRRHGGRLVA